MTTLDWHTKKLKKLSMDQELVVGIELFGTRWKWKEFVFHESLCKMFLKEIAPAGCDRRLHHSIRRRQYINPGPDFAQHTDGYDKLKPWGFLIHGAIDGYSRKILWLKVAQTNILLGMIGSFYLQTVGRLGSCRVKLITDFFQEQKMGWLL